MGGHSLVVAKAARGRHDWQTAYDAALVAEDGTEAERLDVAAEAAWWLGRLDECIAARERAYQLYDEAGDRRAAGQCAVWLYEHYGMRARPAIGSGWLRRARRALAEDKDCQEYGAMLLRESECAHGAGDLGRAATLARTCIDLGRRLRSVDLEAEALQTLGRVLISQGEPADGMAHLDEAMLFAVEGRLGPYSTGKVYCSLIGACEELGDLRRAAEWTEATSRWAQRHPFGIFPGICRVHRAAALGWRGELAEAARQAEQACVELAGSHVPNAGAAHAEVGDIRRRLGDLDGAEAAFRRAEELCGRAFPGVALLRLAQGRIDEATSTISQALDDQPWNRLMRARLLPARAQIAVAAGDVAAASAAVEELESIARDVDAVVLLAAALTARARLHLALGEPAAAGASIRRALAHWQELDVPYEVATSRTILGQSLRDLGEDEDAAASFAAAEVIFAQLGVRVADLPVHQFDQPTLPAGLTEREAQVLRLVAAGHTNRDIAGDLCLSTKTVSRHLSNIFGKIGVATRSAATAFAFEHHIVVPPPMSRR